ncbi:MAG: hypothetical protein ACYCPF_01105 [Streptosporangiaceae bacterium]
MLFDRCTACMEDSYADHRNSEAQQQAEMNELTRYYRHQAAALARALTRAGSPELQPRYRKTNAPEPKWYDRNRVVTRTEKRPGGWAIGEHLWRYKDRDREARTTIPAYQYYDTTRLINTWVLEDGRLTYEGTIDGQDICFGGRYEDVLLTLEKIAERHNVEVPDYVQEALARIRSDQ